MAENNYDGLERQARNAYKGYDGSVGDTPNLRNWLEHHLDVGVRENGLPLRPSPGQLAHSIDYLQKSEPNYGATAAMGTIPAKGPPAPTPAQQGWLAWLRSSLGGLFKR